MDNYKLKTNAIWCTNLEPCGYCFCVCRYSTSD